MCTDQAVSADVLATIEWARKCAQDAIVRQDGVTYFHSVARLSARDVLTLCDLAAKAVQS